MKLVNLLFIIALCFVGIVFSVANRGVVTLSLDPFSTTDPALAVDLRLFWIVFGAMFIGMLIGGSVTWMGQGKTRRNLRASRREEKALRKQVATQTPAPAEKSGLPVVTTTASPPPTPTVAAAAAPALTAPSTDGK